MLIVHHAGKGGEQRGTSRREDVLDTSISLRRPTDYLPTEGARFEVHYEKARGIHGDRAKPFETRLEIRDGATLWTVREIEDVNLARVKALLDDDPSIRDVADETGLSKSTVHQLKKQIDAGQSPEPLSQPVGQPANCPRPVDPRGAPEPVGNQPNPSAVPLSQPLKGRDVGHLTVSEACQACDGLGCPTCRPEKFELRQRVKAAAPDARPLGLTHSRPEGIDMSDEPQILRPFNRAEVLLIAQAALLAGCSVRTMRDWCFRYDIGRKVRGRWYVSKVALAMFLDGDREALAQYLAGDRRSPTWSAISSVVGNLFRGEKTT